MEDEDRNVSISFVASNNDPEYFIEIGDEEVGPLTEGELKTLTGCAVATVGAPAGAR